MLGRFFNGQSKTITTAAIIVGSASFISRLLGILRDRVLAGEFGAGVELDAYYAAFRVPDLLFNLIVLGALSAGFIPVLTTQLKQRAKAWELVNTVLNILLLLLIVVSIVLAIGAPWLVKLITPGFSSDEQALTTVLTRIMFLSPLLLGMSGVFGSVLQTFKRFFIYSLAPILYNIGIIIGALYFTPVLGLVGLAWGVVFGAWLHMVVQMLAVWALGYRYSFAFNLHHKGLGEIARMMVPRTLGLVTGQINFLVITIIGSTLAAGSITIFNLASNIQSFPLGIFGISFAIAAFPTLSELTNRKKQFVKMFSLALRQMLFLIIPASAFLIVLRAQIVRMVLGSGRFDWEDTVLTLETLSFFALSLFAQGSILLIARAFYARHDSKTPFYIGMVAAGANVVLALLFIQPFGVAGLALAFSFAMVLQAVLLIIALHHQIGWLDGRTISRSMTKILVATFMLALVAQASKYPMEQLSGTQTLLGVFLQSTVAIISGSIVYLAVCFILKSEELAILLVSFKKKARKRPSIAEEIIEQEKLT